MSEQQLGRIAMMGKRLASYRSLPPSRTLLVVWASAMLAVTWRAVPDVSDADLVGNFAVLAAAASLGVLCWRQRPRRVELYQNGLIYHVGRRQRRVFWNQVHEIYQVPLHGMATALDSARAPRRWMFKIVKRDGRKLRLHDFELMDSLGMRIQHQVAQRQLPIALDAYQAGYSIRFGRHLAVSTDGIQTHKQFIRWDEVAEIAIEDNREMQVTRVAERKPVFRVATARIPNLAVLDGILRATQEHEPSPDTLHEPIWSPTDAAHSPEVTGDLIDWEGEPHQLMSDGYEWSDIRQVHEGHLSIDDLTTRGPAYRPRQPR